MNSTSGTETQGFNFGTKVAEMVKAKDLRIDVDDITKQEFNHIDTYDFIISEGIEYLPKPEELIAKLKGKFKKYLIISIPIIGFIKKRLRPFLRIFPKPRMLNFLEHLRFWPVTNIMFMCGLLGFIGFKGVKTYGMKNEHYYIGVKLWKYCPRFFSRYTLYKVVAR